MDSTFQKVHHRLQMVESKLAVMGYM